MQTCHTFLSKALKMHSFYRFKTTGLVFSLTSFIHCLFAGGCWLTVSRDSPICHQCVVCPGTACPGDLQDMPSSCLGGGSSAKALRSPGVLCHAV